MALLNDFMKNANGMTRNPLGIIALFVSLIYGFACLVLSSSLKNLVTEYERLPLIWFIIIFPVIILLAFIYLVVNHHTKLYAPSDFRGDDAFFKNMDNKRIKQRQEDEAKTLESAPKNENIELEVEKETESKINGEVNILEETKKVEEVKSEIVAEPIVNKYSNSEKWVSQELSLKYNVLFKANISLSTQYGKIELDAMGQDSDKLYIVETKYWESNKSEKILKLSIQEFLLQNGKLKKVFKTNKEFKLIVALVFDSLKLVDRNEYLKFVKNIYEDANVEFFEYDKLKKSYEE